MNVSSSENECAQVDQQIAMMSVCFYHSCSVINNQSSIQGAHINQQGNYGPSMNL